LLLFGALSGGEKERATTQHPAGPWLPLSLLEIRDAALPANVYVRVMKREEGEEVKKSATPLALSAGQRN